METTANPPPTSEKPIDRLLKPFQLFAENSSAGAIMLMVATALALAWANSPWSASYDQLFATLLTVGTEDFAISKPLLLWINDGLMAIFFFVVGLEIKREMLAGELSSRRKALLPIAAAAGGMIAPALVFAAINFGGEGIRGWGIPMATDIAFALGVLLLVFPRAPIGLTVFLTALAIVDDIGAIAVIAIFYTDSISLVSLAIAAGALVIAALGNRLGVRSSFFYLLVGIVTWVAFLKSGVHATLAAVLMAFTIPGRTRLDIGPLLDRLRAISDKLRAIPRETDHDLLSTEQHHELVRLDHAVSAATAPLQRLEHGLSPLVAFLVMPIFALANAGVAIDGETISALGEPVALGVIFGLFVGKQIGIVGAAWLVVRLGWADLPDRVGWRGIHAVSVLGAIGFTMSLFVASLAFGGSDLHVASKAGILIASLVSAVVATLLLRALPSQQEL